MVLMAAKKKSKEDSQEKQLEEVKEVEKVEKEPVPEPAHTEPPVEVEEEKAENTVETQKVTSQPANAIEQSGEAADKQVPMNGNQEQQQQPANTSDFFGAPPEQKKGGFPKALIVVLLLVVLGGGAGFAYFKTSGQFLGTSTESSPSPIAEEAAPIPQPPDETEEVNLAEFSVQVLNGTGTPGEAGKAQKLLEEAGFEEVDTGNAKSQTNKVTKVSAIADVPEGVIKAVKDALEGKFTVEMGEKLADSSEYDIVVTTGGSSNTEAEE